MSERARPGRVALAIGRQLACPSGPGGSVVNAVMRVANRRPIRALLDALDIKPAHRLIDLGCGDGGALAMAGPVAWKLGIDRSEAMVRAARRRLARDIRAGRADVLLGDIMRAEVPTSSADRIIAANSLYFCADVPALIRHCIAWARPGGKLGIYVTDAACMAEWGFASPETHRTFDATALRREIEAGGVKSSDLEVMPLPLPGGISGLIAIATLR